MEQKFNRIKAALADKGRTSKWLYEALGVSKITVSRWVRNDRQPDLPTLFKIANILEMDVCALLVKEGNQEKETVSDTVGGA